jgi:hypothetical protein
MAQVTMKAVPFILMTFAAVAMSGCGLGMPPPTKKPVTASDIAGQWQYTGMYGDRARISFDTNGTFTLIMSCGAGQVFTNNGVWSLDGAGLILKPFWTTAVDLPKRLEEHDVAHWWITEWYTKGFAPFGGDSPDPDQWQVLQRVNRKPKSQNLRPETRQ